MCNPTTLCVFYARQLSVNDTRTTDAITNFLQQTEMHTEAACLPLLALREKFYFIITRRASMVHEPQCLLSEPRMTLHSHYSTTEII